MENESTHIIAVMREEKQALMQKIHNYEREAGEKEGISKKLKDLEEQITLMTTEIQNLRTTNT